MPVDFLNFYQEAFGVSFQQILGNIWQIIKNWWWFFLPFLILGDESSPPSFLFFWRRWRKDVWYANVYKPRVFEMKIPREIKKPIRAMEKVMNNVRQCVYQPPDWWEKWIEGQEQTSIAFEIASIEGEIHFYMRLHDSYVEGVKAAFHAEYPNVEFQEVDDYVKKVPQDIPNESWDLWGTSFLMAKDDAYPILTYRDFETEREKEEEQRIDPVSTLIEGMNRIGPGEQFWLQIVGIPMGQEPYEAWRAEKEKVRDKIAHRIEEGGEADRRPIVLEALDLLLSGKVPEHKEEEKQESFLPPELKLTPGERNVVEAVERKMSKPVFNSYIRFILLGKRGMWEKSKLRIGFAYSSSYISEQLNALYPVPETLTKIHKEWFLPINLLRPRRMYLRQRRLFRFYIDRLPPHYPLSPGKGAFMLTIEEMASLFHFPSWEVSPVPGVTRVEAKKKPPPELPPESESESES